MAHNSRLLHPQLVARRREHTPDKHSTLALAQMLVWLPPPLQAVNHLPQPQAQAMFAGEIDKWGRMVKTLGLSVK